jgi:hypothetical protein
MDAFVYFYDRLNVPLDDVEDSIDEELRGIGKVTGTGLGAGGANVDILVTAPGIEVEVLLALIRKALRSCDAPAATKIVIAGTQYPLSSPS